jgi:5-methylcytosine-specific restriction endonuclease McrA
MPKAYELPAPGEPFDPDVFRLGKPCKRNHIHADGLTLRYIRRKTCPLCERIDALQRQQQRMLDPACRRKQAEYVAAKRKIEGRPSRSKYGLPYTPVSDEDTIALRQAIKCAGRLPSVARLVYDQQREHWRQNPGDRAEYLRQQRQRNQRWRYMTNESHRLYHRSKSKRRKAQQRGSTSLMLSPDQLWRRWMQFGHECAYCGAGGDLQMEHVIPISKGGEHHLGNIVPACQRCNFSKGRANAEQWYRSQPFFCETRWTKLRNILCRSQPVIEQLSILETPSPPRDLGPTP